MVWYRGWLLDWWQNIVELWGPERIGHRKEGWEGLIEELLIKQRRMDCKVWENVEGIARMLGIAVVGYSRTTTDPCSGDRAKELYIEGISISSKDDIYELENKGLAVKICEEPWGRHYVYLARIAGKRFILFYDEEGGCDKVTGPCTWYEYITVIPIDPVTITVKEKGESVHCGPDGYSYEWEEPPKTVALTPP